ncbi:hypothetical protein [Nocardia heshunensis]
MAVEYRVGDIVELSGPGDAGREGIAPTLIRITEVSQRRVGFVPAGPHGGSDAEPDTAMFDPDDGVPRTTELRFRPYTFLEPGDEVADAAARVWRFETAWEWHPFDDRAGTTPTWPLMLLTRHGDSGDDSAAVDVGEATHTGSHHEELAQWAELAGLDADPAPEPDSGFGFDDAEPDDHTEPGREPENFDEVESDAGFDTDGEPDFDNEPAPAEPLD